MVGVSMGQMGDVRAQLLSMLSASIPSREREMLRRRVAKLDLARYVSHKFSWSSSFSSPPSGFISALIIFSCRMSKRRTSWRIGRLDLLVSLSATWMIVSLKQRGEVVEPHTSQWAQTGSRWV